MPEINRTNLKQNPLRQIEISFPPYMVFNLYFSLFAAKNRARKLALAWEYSPILDKTYFFRYLKISPENRECHDIPSFTVAL